MKSNSVNCLFWGVVGFMLCHYSFVFLELAERTSLAWLRSENLGYYTFFIISAYLLSLGWERIPNLFGFFVPRTFTFNPQSISQEIT